MKTLVETKLEDERPESGGRRQLTTTGSAGSEAASSFSSQPSEDGAGSGKGDPGGELPHDTDGFGGRFFGQPKMQGPVLAARETFETVSRQMKV